MTQNFGSVTWESIKDAWLIPFCENNSDLMSVVEGFLVEKPSGIVPRDVPQLRSLIDASEQNAQKDLPSATNMARALRGVEEAAWKLFRDSFDFDVKAAAVHLQEISKYDMHCRTLQRQHQARKHQVSQDSIVSRKGAQICFLFYAMRSVLAPKSFLPHLQGVISETSLSSLLTVHLEEAAKVFLDTKCILTDDPSQQGAFKHLNAGISEFCNSRNISLDDVVLLLVLRAVSIAQEVARVGCEVPVC